MSRGYTEQVALLASIASEASGVHVEPVAFLRVLVRRLTSPSAPRQRGVPRHQGLLPLAPCRLRGLLEASLNRRLAQRVAHLMGRVYGFDSVNRAGYPLYVQLAVRLSLPPWSQAYYAKHAFGWRPSARGNTHVTL